MYFYLLFTFLVFAHSIPHTCLQLLLKEPIWFTAHMHFWFQIPRRTWDPRPSSLSSLTRIYICGSCANFLGRLHFWLRSSFNALPGRLAFLPALGSHLAALWLCGLLLRFSLSFFTGFCIFPRPIMFPHQFTDFQGFKRSTFSPNPSFGNQDHSQTKILPKKLPFPPVPLWGPGLSSISDWGVFQLHFSGDLLLWKRH